MATPPEKDRATAMRNIDRTFGDVWTRGSKDVGALFTAFLRATLYAT